MIERAGRRRRIAVARLWLEVNAFSPVATELPDFQGYEWDWGEAALRKASGAATEMGAVADLAAQSDSPEIVVLRSAAAVPGGLMSDEVFRAFLSEIEAGLSERPGWDGIYLSLHGATATPSVPSAETALVALIRKIVGPTVPIAATFDMHANLPGALFHGGVNMAVGYKTYPHVDMYEAAEKALTLLRRAMAGDILPVAVCHRVGAILHSFNMRTTDGPMKDIVAFAQSLENDPILDVSAFGGFPFADSLNTGASVVVTADRDSRAASMVSRCVADFMAEEATRFQITLPPPEAVLPQAAAGEHRGLVAILECADNTYTGGIADVPVLFAALRKARRNVPTVFAYFWDPALVSRAKAAGTGATLDATLGGRVTDEYGSGVQVRATVAHLTDGRFVNEGPMERGRTIEMGASAVLLVDGIKVVVTSTRQPVNDLGYFRLHAIDLSQTGLLCVKAKNHFRASLGPYCAQIIEVDTPGPAQIDLRRFPYRNVPVGLLEQCVGPSQALEC